jgi:AraC family transcriptional regulator of adaptative response / DNA-3-methyladenine glycosylase II
VLTTGIYCLPSCPARKPLAANVRFFEDEAAAQAAGLRPCKRCRPDAFYRGEDAGLVHLETAMSQALARPEAFPDVEALAEAAGVGLTKLKALFRTHAQQSPAAFLQQARIRFACTCLREGQGPLLEVAHRSGYASSSGFHEAFRLQTGLSPGAYRRLLASDRFRLPHPPGLRVEDVLAFHGRDPESVSERVVGRRLQKAFLCEGRPSVVSLVFQAGHVDVHLTGASGARAMASAHAAVLRLLGWSGPPGPLEAAHPELVSGREGLRVLLTLDPFEALVWAILGQQVNLGFAYALRRDLIRLAGLPAAEGLVAHPDARGVAALRPEALLGLRFSRRKAEYLLHAATEVAEGRLGWAAHPSATGMAKRLLELRGCGPWTAQYVLMRGLGFQDCVPVGDAGLTLALQRWFHLEARPDPAETMRLMAPFAPHRSLATFHFWSRLKGTPA